MNPTNDFDIIKCILFNARSIVNKLSDLYILLNNYYYDFIFFTESWLTANIPNSLLVQDYNYNIFRKDRANSRIGGGIVIFVKKCFNSTNIAIDCSCLNSDILFFDVHFATTSKIRFGCVYNPPSSASDNIATKLLCKVIHDSQVFYPYILVGDFNYPNIDWAVPFTSGNICHQSFLSSCMQNNLSQLVDKATRKSNILDLILCNCANRIIKTELCHPFTDSCDHEGVQFSVVVPKATHNPSSHTTRNFFKGNYININAYLSSINWVHRFRDLSIHDMWLVFKQEIDFCITTYVPFINFFHKKHTTPSNIRKLAVKKRQLWIKSKTNPEIKEQYKLSCKLYKKAVIDMTNFTEASLITNNSPKAFFAYVNKKLKNRPSIPPLVNDITGDLATDDSTKSEILNNFFASVFTDDNNDIPNFQPITTNTINTVIFTPDMVERKLLQLPTKASITPDGYPSILFKLSAKSIAHPLCLIFDKSMSSGVLPLDWKLAIVSPIYKKGDSSKANNYRPISLTCIACKVMESIVRTTTTAYLNKFNLITEEQHGFLSKRSTCSQLMATINDWTNAANNKKRVDSVYIDFAKAFDTVCHSKLMVKLAGFGIASNLFVWIKDFLSFRSQKTTVGNATSSSVKVSSGVPQGSVLGPLLFILYVNDIPICLEDNSKVKLYADDTKLYTYRSLQSNDSHFTNTLNNFVTWSKAWQLTIAFNKCYVLSCGNTKIPNIAYKLHDTNLEAVKEIRDIGVIITSDLKFSKHCSFIAGKAYSRACLILRSFSSKNPVLLMNAFIVYVRPIVESATPVWSPYMIKDIRAIERIQRYFTKAICGKSNINYRDYSDRLHILKVHSLEYRRIIFDLIFCYKILNNLIDLKICDFFELDNTHRTRGHRFKLRTTSIAVTNARLFSFPVRIVPIWNSLPNDTVNSHSILSFRSKLNNTDLSKFCKCFPF